MIKNDFFADGATYRGSNQTEVVVTDITDVVTVGCDNDNFPGAYYMGYMRYEDIPSAFHPFLYEVTDDEVIFTDKLNTDNYNVLYLGREFDLTNAPTQGLLNGAITNISGLDYWWSWYSNYAPTTPLAAYRGTIRRFINECDAREVYFSTSLFTITVCFCYQYGNSLDAMNNYGRAFVPLLNNPDSPKRIVDFLTGEETRTLTFAVGAETISIVYDAKDFTDSPFKEVNIQQNGVYYRIVYGIYHYNFFPNQADYAQGIFPAMLVTIKDFDDYTVNPWTGAGQRNFVLSSHSSGVGQYSGASTQSASIRINKSNFNRTVDSDVDIAMYKTNSTTDFLSFRGGYKGRFNKAALAALPTDAFIYDGNTLFCCTSYLYYEVFRFCTPKEVYAHLSLIIRICQTYVSGFSNESVYVPLIESDNRFTGTMITGELNDIITQLRPWQYSDWTTNTYTEADKPEYGGEDREYNGDEKFHAAVDIPFLPRIPGFKGFLTQYVFNSTLVEEFARMFWTKFVSYSGGQLVWDFEYISNFIIALANTGTLDISNLLQYIVSVQVFPFDIRTICSETFTSLTNYEVFIGSGVIPIPVNPSPYPYIPGTIDQMAVQFGGQRYQFKPRFNDFRDFTATSIELYIPFCGTVDIDTNLAYDIVNGQVVGNTIEIFYTVDMQTGHLTAQVNLRTTNLSTFPIVVMSGKCSAQIPLSAGVVGQMTSRMVGAIGSGIAAAAATHEVTVGKVTYGTAKTGKIERKITEQVHDETPIQGAASGLNDIVNSSPFSPSKTSVSPFADMFSQVRHPYVVYRTGRYHIPDNYSHTFGKQFLYRTTISNLNNGGFIKCVNVDCKGIPALSNELKRIKSLLESGVYF